MKRDGLKITKGMRVRKRERERERERLSIRKVMKTK